MGGMRGGLGGGGRSVLGGREAGAGGGGTEVMGSGKEWP